VTPPPSLSDRLPPPAPHPALLEAVEGMRPVRTRSPGRTALLLLAAGAIFPLAMLAYRHLRRDLSALPVLWVAAAAAAWTIAVVATLTSAVIPRRGEVLPNVVWAGRAALLAALGLLALGLFGTVDAPGYTLAPPSFRWGWWHCTRFGLAVTVPTLFAAALTLRGLYPFGGRRIGAAVGAAGGALAGLTLHFLCPYGGGAHVGLVHAGGVVIGAVLGALLLGPLLRFADAPALVEQPVSGEGSGPAHPPASDRPG
jgi:hypothetical protein